MRYFNNLWNYSVQFESLIRNCFRIRGVLFCSIRFWCSECSESQKRIVVFLISLWNMCREYRTKQVRSVETSLGFRKNRGIFLKITPENLHKFSGPRDRREEVISVKKAQKKRPKPLKMKNIHWQTPNGYDMMLFHTVIVCPFRAIHPNMVMLPQMGAVVKR